MSIEAIAIVVATVLAGVIPVFLLRYWRSPTRGGLPTRYRHLKYKDIPIWICHRLYEEGFRNKLVPIPRKRFHFRGHIYEYEVQIKESGITEPMAHLGHIVVSKRRFK